MTYNDPFNSNDSQGNNPQNQQNPAPNLNYQQAQNAANAQGYYAAGQNPVMEAQPVRVSERAVHNSVTAAYGEMAIGVGVTALVSWISYQTNAIVTFLGTVGQVGWIVLLVAQVALALVLAARVFKMNPATARVLFYVYAASMGFTLSTIFYVYTLGSIVLALGLTAGFFLCLTMIGLTTKANLLKAGPILMTALVVLIVAEVIMMFMQVSGANMILAGISLIIFAGLTAYDAQRTRAMYQQLGTSDVMVRRISILAALNLYLDFINMFMSVLQLFGSRN
jgi:FtsH-binding integral membrane protein